MTVSTTAPTAQRGPRWRAPQPRTWLLGAVALALGITVLLVVLMQSELARREQIRRALTYELPAQLQAAASDVQAQLNLEIAGSQALANNTFIQSWIEAGRPDSGLPGIEQALAGARRTLHAETAFLAVTLPDMGTARYYFYKDGHMQTRLMEPGNPRDKWYFRLARGARPFELHLDHESFSGFDSLMFINYRGDAQALATALPQVLAGIGIDRQPLAQLIRAHKIGGSGFLMLVGPDGLVEAHPDPAQSGRLNLHDQPAFAPLLAGDWQLARGHDAAIVQTVQNGQPAYAAALYLPDLQRYLVALLPQADITQGIAHNQWLTLAAGAALLMLALLILASFLSIA